MRCHPCPSDRRNGVALAGLAKRLERLPVIRPDVRSSLSVRFEDLLGVLCRDSRAKDWIGGGKSFSERLSQLRLCSNVARMRVEEGLP